MRSVLGKAFALILLMALLPVRSNAQESMIRVWVEEGSGYTVEQNGIMILPGEDVTFTIQMDYGNGLIGADYSGEIKIEEKNRTARLTLFDVNYPTRVTPVISTQYAHISYDANDGSGSSIEKRYSMTAHPRPNTENGPSMFQREGYTLYAWNTRADGSGTRIGLGSRATPVNGFLKLYAQWAQWTNENCFDWTVSQDGSAIITSCRCENDSVVIPARIGEYPVTTISAGAFQNCRAETVILPETIKTVEDGAFIGCALQTLTLWDRIESISDNAFVGCDEFRTVYINAYEKPYGYLYRRESMYADKVEMLIGAKDRKKLIFYSGCSMWYNLDAAQVQKEFGEDYVIINMGLNGTVSSAVQLQIMKNYLSDGDIVFHAPELSSRQQLMICTDMDENDISLWAGLENNYDLFSLVDLRTVGGVFSSFSAYLGIKDSRTDYQSHYTDSSGNTYLDQYGSVPFYRASAANSLNDPVTLDPELISGNALDTLKQYYQTLISCGAEIVVSYACINTDALPDGQKNNVGEMDAVFREQIGRMPGVALISRLPDYLYCGEDFYDTNYHLCTAAAKRNTENWVSDLSAHMDTEADNGIGGA